MQSEETKQNDKGKKQTLNNKVGNTKKKDTVHKDAYVEQKIKYNLVEFSVDFFWPKLFKKAPKLQCINGHNLCASSLPVISETKRCFTNICTVQETKRFKKMGQ